MARQGHYEALLYGEGLLKTVFKAVKAAASGQGLDRVFITGVSPVVLSDLTSGYNVGENIYLEPAFNDLCGFTEAEIAAVLARLAGEGVAWSPAEALDTMRTFYNGYRFSEAAVESLYNPTLALYFFKGAVHLRAVTPTSCIFTLASVQPVVVACPQTVPTALRWTAPFF